MFVLISRFGFNSEGHDVVFERINNLRQQKYDGIIGVNLGKNKTSPDPISDYVTGIEKFGSVADYLVINVSRLVLRAHSICQNIIIRSTMVQACFFS